MDAARCVDRQHHAVRAACVSFHGNDAPDIDSREHRLLINGMVERPLVFTMDELMRLPAVSRIHYIECIANVPHPRGKTLEEMHGMVGCSKWTGVPLSLLLDEVGVRAGGNWILAEGAEATKVGASLPMGKAMDIEAPARRIALTCFTFPWTWNGQEAVLQSRCTDDEERVILLPVVRFPPA